MSFFSAHAELTRRLARKREFEQGGSCFAAMADLFAIASALPERSWLRIFTESELEVIRDAALGSRDAFQAFIAPRTDGATLGLLSSADSFAEDAPAASGKPVKRARQQKVFLLVLALKVALTCNPTGVARCRQRGRWRGRGGPAQLHLLSPAGAPVCV